MFNEDLESFILENVNFEGTGQNQDIYYNMTDKRFWIGNESLSPDSEKNNILIYKIRNGMDWETWNGCQSCESHNSNTCRYEECMSESLYEAVNESDYIFDHIRPQILGKINPDIIPFIGLSHELSKNYDKHHEYMQKVFNSNLYEDIEEDIVEGILSYGFREDGNDNAYLSKYIENLKTDYMNQHEDLKQVFTLLDDYKVKEAAKYLNEANL